MMNGISLEKSNFTIAVGSVTLSVFVLILGLVIIGGFSTGLTTNGTAATHLYSTQGAGQYPQAVPAQSGLSGIAWGYHEITYSFQNFTVDVEQQETREVFESAFAQWADSSPIEFREVGDSTDSDIRISFTLLDGLEGALAETKVWSINDKIQRVEIHIDDSETWSASNQTEDLQPKELFIVATHEIGHALGLSHSLKSNAVMGEFYDPTLDSLTQVDIDEVQSIYIERAEDDD